MAHMGHGEMAEGSGMSPPTMGGDHGKHGWTHMTFFQGKNSEILFKGWPGRNDGGMYALALIVVFILAILAEWVESYAFNRGARSRLVFALVKTAIHAIQVALHCLLMLAIMSFNVGVILVAIGGRALGYFLFRSSFCLFKFNKRDSTQTNPTPSDSTAI